MIHVDIMPSNDGNKIIGSILCIYMHNRGNSKCTGRNYNLVYIIYTK